MREKNKSKGKKKKNLVLKFLTIVGTVVGVFVVLFGVVVAAYFKFAPKQILDKKGGTVMAMESEGQKEEEGFLPNVFGVPLRTNFLIMGVNPHDYLADSILAGCFNADTQRIDLISIPRDTYTVLPEEVVQELKDDGRRLYGQAQNGIMKLNEVHSWGGKEKGNRFLQDEVERMLGIKFDYYVELDTTAFRKIVDAVGGVEMEIPKGGLHYVDPDQGLSINVPGGLQKLDGKLAEGVVRYRATYPRADLQRIEVQHEFMKQFFVQVLNRDTIIKNFPSIATTILSYVKTDFGISDLPKYLKYLPDLKGENLVMQTIPGEAKTITYSSDSRVSYFMCDEEETREMAQAIFFGAEADEDEQENVEETLTSEEVKALKIQVLNGGEVTGLAARVQETLKAAGYNVVNTGNYTGTRKKETRIMTNHKLRSDEFEEYFKDAVLERDKELPQGYDIIIIVGLDEK